MRDDIELLLDILDALRNIFVSSNGLKEILYRGLTNLAIIIKRIDYVHRGFCRGCEEEP